MSEPSLIISLVIGDWSRDGHEKSETINIKSNLDKKSMEKAYKKATKKIGFDFCSDVCTEWEDNLLHKDKLDILFKNGLKIKDLDIDYDLKQVEAGELDSVSLWHDDFLSIYLFLVKLGNEEFKYEYLDDEVNPTIHIGGYGLFE